MDVYGIEALLGLPACHVIDQVIGPQRLDLALERRETCLVCPRCQTCCSRVKERRPRGRRALPIREPPVLRWLHGRRFACQGCPHRPGETRETFGAHVQWTERLSPRGRAECLGGCPGRALARRSGLSERTVCRWTVAKRRGGRPRKLGRALGIDEYARRKGHRSHTLRVDGDKGQPRVTLKGRRADDGVGWCRSRPQEEGASVDGVVLEMSQTYASAIKALVGASVQVSERFPVVHVAVNALDEVLRSVQKHLDTEAATARKTLRRRWLTSANQRKVDEWIARYAWRRRLPPLRAMIDWVQDVRRWCERTEEKPAREALWKRIERASQRAQEPLKRMAGTWTRWFEPMVHYIRNRSSNGMTEGFHNKIKLIQRMASGLRNEHNRRKRLLAWCGKT